MLDQKIFRLIIIFKTAIIAAIIFLGGCTGYESPIDEHSEEVELLNDFIILATTTSTYDSGLMDYLNPVFTEKTGLEVQVVSQGTGAALETGARGDADVLLVHDRDSELRLVEEGAFINRHDVMYNDFIIVGPAEDPAAVLNVDRAVNALKLIANMGHTFISRGDDSGTHRMEIKLWEKSGIDPVSQGWYRSIGQGMGETLTMASEKLAYALTDRGTYISRSGSIDLVIVLQSDPVLFNQYGVMAVNPDVHPHVKYDYAMMYIEFLISEEGQQLINSYQVNGKTLFFPGYGLE